MNIGYHEQTFWSMVNRGRWREVNTLFLQLEFNDDEILAKVKEIENLSDELKRKVSEFQMLLKAKSLSAVNTDSRKDILVNERKEG